jgi:hypothetical protein
MQSASKIAREKTSKAVISVDDHALAEYRKSRELLRKKNARIDSLEERLAKLEMKLELVLQRE